jgi:hypothetical protein
MSHINPEHETCDMCQECLIGTMDMGSHLDRTTINEYFNYTPKLISSRAKDSYRKDYLYKEGRGTSKAQFFMVSYGINGNYGFWCPRSAIISDTGKAVEIASWCKVTEIQYNRDN